LYLFAICDVFFDLSVSIAACYKISIFVSELMTVASFQVLTRCTRLHKSNVKTIRWSYLF